MYFYNFVEGVPCWVKDRSGVYCWVNRAFLLNYSMDASPDAVVGKTDDDLSPGHLADQFRLDDSQVIEREFILNRLELVGRFELVGNCFSLGFRSLRARYRRGAR